MIELAETITLMPFLSSKNNNYKWTNKQKRNVEQLLEFKEIQ